jgi:integration host factor subunit beta
MMTKKDIAKRIALDVGVPQLRALEVVQRTFDEIIRAVSTEARIELRNFGVFEVRRRAARRARNPRTGEKLVTPARNVVTFRPGREMEQLIGGGVEEENPQAIRAVATEDSAPSPSPKSSRKPKKQASSSPAR